MSKRLVAVLVLCGLLTRPAWPSEGEILTASGEGPQASAGKSILCGAAVGALVAAAASAVNAKGALYQFSFFVTLGSAAGLGHYLLSVPPRSAGEASHERREPDGFAVSFPLLAWNF